MNHINWVQQDPDYKTEYHVLKWRSSHFHEPQARRMIDSALHKEGASSAVSAGALEPGIAKIGLGSASSVKSGGFGLGHGQDGVNISAHGAEKQSGEAAVQAAGQWEIMRSESVAEQVGTPGAYNAARAVKETTERAVAALQSGKAGHNTVAAAAGQGGIRNRLKRGAAYLLEEYQKQKEKLKRTLFRPKRVEKQTKVPRRSTREADREEILSMQAQNHYLLDSYDRSGQYHMLGK